MKLELINVGRNKVNKIIVIKQIVGNNQIFKIVSEYLYSTNFYFLETEKDSNVYDIIAGFRTVGQIKLIYEN